MVGIISVLPSIQSSHLELLGALVISLITALITYKKSKSTEHASQFTVFMKESAAYREELRQEQKDVKEQLDKQIESNEIMKAKLIKITKELEDAKIEIKLLTEKVRQLKELQIIVNNS